MSRLAECLKKIGLDTNDQQRIEALLAEGVSERRALRQAMQEIDRDITDLVGRIEAAGGQVARQPDILSQDSTGVPKRHQVPLDFIEQADTGPLQKKSRSPILKVLNETNIERQIERLNRLSANHPDPLSSPEAWRLMERELTGDIATPAPPYRMTHLANNIDEWAQNHSRLTPEQVAAAHEGFRVVEEFRALYESGDTTPATTGKLMLWGMMSRMLSAHPHESAFLDAAMSEELEDFINLAIAREWTDQDVARYLDWAGSVIPDFAPGKQGTSNMNDFGKLFLKKMSKRMPDGRSALEHLHEMVGDHSVSSVEVRRRFYGLAGSVGIKNKVLSFMLLVTGRDDVVVLDRIQINTWWDSGRYGRLIYDEVAPLFEDAHGLARYEALERSLLPRIQALYDKVGRPQDASVGRYHWESWVLNSGQIVAHPTLQGMVNEVTGEADPFSFIGAPEGRFQKYAFGSIYAIDDQGGPYILYNTSGGTAYRFGLEDFKKFLDQVRDHRNGVVPKGFQVTPYRDAGYPWYEAQEVNREKLDALIAKAAQRPASERERLAQTSGQGSDPAVSGQTRAEEQLNTLWPLSLPGAQEFDSGATSRPQVPAGTKRIDWTPGTVNADIGGGKYELHTEHLAALGVESIVYDPVNRSEEHNLEAVRRISDGQADTATIHNVLNVIKEAQIRAAVITQAYEAVRYGGEAYFTVHQGSAADQKKGARETKGGSWQEFRKTETYMPEIEAIFGAGNVERKGTLIIARKPAINERYADVDPWSMPIEELYNHPMVEQARQALEKFKRIDSNDPARQAQQQEIADRVFTEQTSKHEIKREKKVWLVLGPSASGKSSLVEGANGLAAQTGSVVVDSDHAKELIPEFRNGAGADVVHEESKVIAKGVHERAYLEDMNIVDPLVGGNLAKVQKKIADYHKLGYTVGVRMVDLHWEETFRRAMARFIHTGRFIPPSYLYESVGYRPAETYLALLEGGTIDDIEAFSSAVQRGQPLERIGDFAAHARGRALPEVQSGPGVQRQRGPGLDSEEGAAQELAQFAYHGTGTSKPHDQFSTRYIGGPGGEGNQAFGWGLYFADDKAVADHYRKAHAYKQVTIDGKLPSSDSGVSLLLHGWDQVPEGEFDTWLARRRQSAWQRYTFASDNLAEEQASEYPDPEVVAELQEEANQLYADFMATNGLTRDRLGTSESGRLYKVDLKPEQDEYLLWDKPLSRQSEKVRKALANRDNWFGKYRAEAEEIALETGAYLDDTGESLYREIESQLGSDKAASQFLASIGIRGVKYLDGSSRMGGRTVPPLFSLKLSRPKRNYNYVIFDDADVEILEFYQKRDNPRQVKQGGYRPLETGNLIRLFESADLSTFLHEFGHLALQMELSGPRTELTDQILAMLGAESVDDVLVRPGETIPDSKREKHEKFARSFEAYLFEGKAPSPELRSAFQRIATWMKAIYQDLQMFLERHGIVVNDEVRQVFDRMLATEEEIAQAQAQMQYAQPLFTSAAAAGMTASEWEDYQKRRQRATDKASETLQAKLLREIRRSTEKWWKDELKGEQRRAYDELGDEPVYRAREDLSAEPQMMQPTLAEMGEKLSGPAVAKLLQVEYERQQNYQAPKRETSDERTARLRRAYLAVKASDVPTIYTEGAMVVQVRPVKLPYQPAFDWHMGKDEYGDWIILSPKFNGATMAYSAAKTQKEALAEAKRKLQKMGKDGAVSAAKKAHPTLYSQEVLEARFRKKIGLDAPTPVPKNRVNAESVRELYDGAIPDGLKKLVHEDAMLSVDDAAAAYGYESGTAFTKALLEAPNRSEAARERAEQVMKQRHGDILNDGTLEAEALAAAHNEERGKLILQELRILNRKLRNRTIDIEALKARADETIRALPVNELRPDRYRRAELRAAQNAAQASSAEDRARFKLQQATNFYLWKAAMAARERRDKIRADLQRLKTRNYKPSSMSPAHLAKMRAYLAAYDFRKTVRQDVEETRARLLAIGRWLQSQADDISAMQIYDPKVTELLMADKDGNAGNVEIKNWKTMTIAELEGVRDQAHHMRFVGQRMADAEAARLSDQHKKLAAHVRDVFKDKPLPKEGSRMETVLRAGRDFASNVFLHASSVLRRLDGFKDNGPMYKAIKRPIDDANNRLLQLQEETGEALSRLYTDHYSNKELRENNRRIEVAGREMTRWQIISLALNQGNAENKTAVLAGIKNDQPDWTEAQVGEALAQLDKRDWDFVQATWDYLDTFKSEMFEIERRITGVAPKPVEPAPVKTRFGVYRGGYFPLKYDPQHSWRMTEATANELMKQHRGLARAHTKDGMLQERVGSGGKPVLLSIDVVQSHVSQVVNYIAMAEAVNQVQGTLTSKPVTDAMIATGNREALMGLQIWLRDVAIQEILSADATSRMARALRVGFSTSKLGWNVGTMLMQPLGVTQSMPVVGYGRMVKTFGQVLAGIRVGRNLANEQVMARSVYMRNRGLTFNKDIRDTLDMMHGDPAKPGFIPDGVRRSFFAGIIWTQRFVDSATWMAAYEKYKGEHPSASEADLVNFADQVVGRAQASGVFSERTPFERGTISTNTQQSEFVRMWTALSSYFLAKGNIAYELTAKTQFSSPKQTLKWAVDMTMLFWIEAILVGMLRNTIPDEDDDESLAAWHAQQILLGVLGVIPFAREVGSELSGFRSGGTVAAFAADIGKAGTQIFQGEIDAPLLKTLNNLGGTLFRYPSAAINRAVEAGVEDWEGDDFDPMQYLIYREDD